MSDRALPYPSHPPQSVFTPVESSPSSLVLGPLLSVDQPASAEYTEELLGWQPTQSNLIEDLDKDHYFAE